MKTLALYLGSFAIVTLGLMSGCSGVASKSPDVSETVRRNLDQAGLTDVTVTQDRDKGVITLGGHVGYVADKSEAEGIAKSSAGNQVVANEIAIVPPSQSHDAKTVTSDLDEGIEKNLDAALIQSGLDKAVHYDVMNGVVMLTGDVNSEAKRSRAASVASKVPNVQQVVNELQLKDQKATTTH